MKLIARQVSASPDKLQPARSRRDWMDAANHKFPYRCLPLSMANSWGWEVLSSTHFIAEWNGGPATTDINIKVIDGPRHHAPSSHFGVGTLTWHTGYIFITEYPYALYVSGAPNMSTPVASPLSGIVETYWLPFTFTMNWRFTQPGSFEMKIGEPYCQFFPVDITVFENIEPEIHDFSEEDNKEFVDLYVDWSTSRSEYLIKGRYNKLSKNNSWQRHYFQGTYPPDGTRKCPVIHNINGTSKSIHKTKPNTPEFVDKRSTTPYVLPESYSNKMNQISKLENEYRSEPEFIEKNKKLKNLPNKQIYIPLDVKKVDSKLDEMIQKVLHDSKKHNNKNVSKKRRNKK
jgi:hypothetical protein